MRPHVLALTVASSLVLLAGARRAEACGCFLPPDGTVPVVQAGERILFARENGLIVAHIQIQFAGAAGDFGWLLPLPSVPQLELGTDELFIALDGVTQPQYQLETEFEDCDQGSAGEVGCGGGSPDSSGSGDYLPNIRDAAASGGPLVGQDSVGPYDYAVLRADSKTAMLDWLAQNRYFVPTGTDDAVSPYIRPNAYFLALKLRSGKSTGDLQPVVVRYESDLPMIPIVLTSVAAQPDMGISVYMLGRGRAIPRNYAHTVLNDAAIDWVGGARNYNDVVVRATREAEGRHTFITEYAGPSNLMVGRLGNRSRFGAREDLEKRQGIDAVVAFLNSNGFGATGALNWPPQLVAILAAHAPMPAALDGSGLTPARFYPQVAYYRSLYPNILGSWQPELDVLALTDEIWERIVLPTRAAGKLFEDHPYLTRLYTTLSPNDMTRDPVFSENGKLPDVSNVHKGRMIYRCLGRPLGLDTPVTVVTEQGRRLHYPNGVQNTPRSFTTPGSLRIESVAEEGPPQTMIDNSLAIVASLPSSGLPEADGSGCALGRGRSFGAALLLLLIAARLWRARRAAIMRG